MVFFYAKTKKFLLFCGEDKFENEKLIKWCLPTDIWFHVDGLSSAHIYLRNIEPNGKKGMELLESLPEKIIELCCQLVKLNSIKGKKLNKVNVNYTPAKNLRKTDDMEVGSVNYYDRKKVRNRLVEKNKKIIKALEKAKTLDNDYDFKKEYDMYYKEELNREKMELRKRRAEEKEREKLRKARDYDGHFDSSKMKTNKQILIEKKEKGSDSDDEYDSEDDFM